MLLCSTRDKAARKSNKSSEQMVKKHAAKNPPSVYRAGENVLVKLDSAKWNKVKGKGVSVPPSTVAKIVETKGNKYKVSLCLDDKERQEWIDVSKITSLTRAADKLRDKSEGGIPVLFKQLYNNHIFFIYYEVCIEACYVKNILYCMWQFLIY